MDFYLDNKGNNSNQSIKTNKDFTNINNKSSSLDFKIDQSGVITRGNKLFINNMYIDKSKCNVINSNNYKKLQTIDPDMLYIINDTSEVYLGKNRLTGFIIFCDDNQYNHLNIRNTLEGVLYVNKDTCGVKANTGKSILEISPGYLTDEADWDTADPNKLPTIGLVKKGLEQTVNISIEKEDNPTPELLASYTIKQGSTELSPTIDIPKGNEFNVISKTLVIT